jgi:predicted Fe-Mo cluster-binding NifX family protein
MDYQYLPNTACESLHGAGIQAAQAVANQKVQAVITGIVGPNAHRVLSEAGIEIITGVAGTVRDALRRYGKGELRQEQGPAGAFAFGRGMMKNGDQDWHASESYRPRPSQSGSWVFPSSLMRERGWRSALATQDELAFLQEREKALVRELSDLQSSIDELKRRRVVERPT